MKIPVGVLGATGIVGQQYLRRLAEHPLFEVVYVAASERSAGKSYAEAVQGRFHLPDSLPKRIQDLLVYPLEEHSEAISRCRLLFSALDNDAAIVFEPHFASQGFAIVSNASWSRKEADIPVIIPEINSHHLDIIPAQQKNRAWKGFIVTKPCCTVQSYTLPLALIHKRWPIDKVFVTSMQAVSGAGFPGVASLDILDNIVPLIRGEEEKCEEEPLKILGAIKGQTIVKESHIKISAHCNRVPVTDGHLACVSFSVQGKKPHLTEVVEVLESFSGLTLPSAPQKPLHYHKAEDRPQPRKDRDREKGMAVSVGRLRSCPLLDFRFVGLSHNTARGAAGGGILNGELLAAKGFI